MTRKRLLALDLDDHAAAWLERRGDTVAALRTLPLPDTDDPQALLRAALDAAPKPPTDLVVLSPHVTPLVVDIPQPDLPPERLAGLLRWELEAFLPPDGPDGATPPACGWASPAPDRVLACGLPDSERTRWLDAAQHAKLHLLGLYPSLGAGAALAPPTGTATEARGDRHAHFTLLDGRVTDLHLTPAAPLDTPPLSSPTDPQLPASLLGAAHHAFGLPGAERVPAIDTRPPVLPLRKRTGVQLTALAAVVLASLGLCEAWLHNRRATREATWRDLDAQVGQARRRVLLSANLDDDLERARTDLHTLRARASLGDAYTQRRDYLPGVLAILVHTLPADVALEALHEDEHGALVVEGFALRPLAIQEYLRDLGLELAAYGLRPPHHADSQLATGRLGVRGHRFTLRFTPDRENAQ